MDSLTFIATMTGHLAWPVFALIVLIVLLWKAKFLAGFVRRIRYGDLDIEVGQQIEAAREKAENVRATLPAETPQVREEEADKVIQLAKIDPGVAIVMIWRSLEAAITRLIQHNGLIRFTSPRRFMHQLARMKKISEDELRLFESLREIRNVAVHSDQATDITVAEVVEFAEFVRVMRARLEAIAAEPGYIDVDDAKKD